MAPWGAGGDERQPIHPFDGYSHSSKRRIDDFDDGEDYYQDYRSQELKRTRSDRFAYDVPFLAEPEPQPESEPELAPAPEFLVLREHGVARLTADAPVMERTASGLSIRSDTTERCASTELLEDDEAAQRVRDHMVSFRRRFPDSKHERILRSIINPRSFNAEYPLDNDSLESIFSAANEIFFNGRLSQRVTWDWSHESSAQYDAKVIGTTALRRASNRGFETLIVLSSPILKDGQYSRRLLISTFLHELIHCYMFICCGFRARHCGGHTPGFRQIAQLVDDWIGPESMLYLCKMEADLERFRIGGDNPERRASSSATLPATLTAVGPANILPCSGCCHVSGEEQQQQQHQQQPQLHSTSQPDYYLCPPVRRGQRVVRPLHAVGGDYFVSSIRYS